MAFLPPSDRGRALVRMKSQYLNDQYSHRAIWQSIADVMHPFMNPITDVFHEGQDLMEFIYDSTAMEESENMTSGLINNIMPAGQEFFTIMPTDRREQQSAAIGRYLDYLTEETHLHLVTSNFGNELGNTILNWLLFGNGVMYSTFVPGMGLNYADYGVGLVQFSCNQYGIVDTMLYTVERTAEQFVGMFGEDGVGEKVQMAFQDEKTRQNKFHLIHIVRPREVRDPRLSSNTNMPWESVYVCEEDAVILQESGYEEFPFAAPRYHVVYGETYGRGRGLMALRPTRILNRSVKDLHELGNKIANPPLEVLDGFDGEVDLEPNALNYVSERYTIAGIERGAIGDYPTGKDWIIEQRTNLQKLFGKDIFEQLGMLSGDRRTQLEIAERLKEGMKKLSKPIGKLFTELFDPVIMRSIRLLIRNGVVDPPPPGLTSVNINYLGPLALALRDQQAKGVRYWMAALGELEQLGYEGVSDNVDADLAARDLGVAYGTKAEHIREERERDEIRQARMEAQQRAMEMEMMAQGADAYNKATKSPEQGSPAQKIMR